MDKDLYNASFTYDNTSGTFNIQKGLESQSCFIDYDWYTGTWIPQRQEYITHTIHTTVIEDKFKKAYEIAKFLVANRYVVSNKLRDFMNIVEKIAKIL